MLENHIIPADGRTDGRTKQEMKQQPECDEKICIFVLWFIFDAVVHWDWGAASSLLSSFSVHFDDKSLASFSCVLLRPKSFISIRNLSLWSIWISSSSHLQCTNRPDDQLHLVDCHLCCETNARHSQLFFSNEYSIKQLALDSRWQSVRGARIKHIFNLKSKPVSFDRRILQIQITRNRFFCFLFLFFPAKLESRSWFN